MNWQTISNSVLFALLGVVLFVAIFVIIDRVTPYHLWRELVEKQNTALAIVVGFAALGICVIVAAAIH
jgi:putative membrane protein